MIYEVGGISGKGWRMSEYARRGWLPEVTTDSVFPAFGEEFGLIKKRHCFSQSILSHGRCQSK